MFGKPPWNKGKKYTTDQIKKMDLSGLKLGHKNGNKHRYWKGDFASYSALHYWLYRQVGKANYCSKNTTHKSTRYHWANISGLYKRDVNDFMALCPSCHHKYDKIGSKMWKTRRGVNL